MYAVRPSDKFSVHSRVIHVVCHIDHLLHLAFIPILPRKRTELNFAIFFSGMIIVPTRELALQTSQIATEISKHLGVR